MSGVIYLLAGDPFSRSRKPDPAMQAFLKEVGKPKPRVAYIGTASGDDLDFFQAMRAHLRACGAGEAELVPLCGVEGGLDDARKMLGRADAVFVSGGDVEEGMNGLRAHDGLIAYLRELFEQGVPFMGLSAGSTMLARGWVHWAEEGRGRDMLFDCLGFAPIYCDVHGEADDWDELKALLRLLPAGIPGYAIRTGEALRVRDGLVERVAPQPPST